MALEEAATILERSERTKNNVVFLTDALSVLQSIKSNKDKEQQSSFTKLTGSIQEVQYYSAMDPSQGLLELQAFSSCS